MFQDSGLVVVRAYSLPLEAEMACSALRAAGIEARLADDHVVGVNWLWSNAVGGVKVLVSPQDAAAAEEVLAMPAAVDIDAVTSNGSMRADQSAECPRCGSHDTANVTAGRRLAFLTWLAVGVPVVPVLRRMRCEACGHRFRVRETA
jgi:DNA-directed RNA polymerase subunit RPC12/RpoP